MAILTVLISINNALVKICLVFFFFFFLQPGEIILYESASVIHGRPTAFQGESYANIFVHYSPVEGYTVTNRQVQQAAADAARKGRTEKKTAMAK